MEGVRGGVGGKASDKVTAEDMLQWVRGKGPRATALATFSGLGGYTPTPAAIARGRKSTKDEVGEGAMGVQHPPPTAGVPSARRAPGGGGGVSRTGVPTSTSTAQGNTTLGGHSVLTFGSRTGRGGNPGGGPPLDELGTLLYNPVVRNTGSYE